jgi:IS30 family transposase
MATLGKRQSHLHLVVKVPGKDTASVVTALSKRIPQLSLALCRSSTWDQGMELAQHKRLIVDATVPVYSCAP